MPWLPCLLQFTIDLLNTPDNDMLAAVQYEMASNQNAWRQFTASVQGAGLDKTDRGSGRITRTGAVFDSVVCMATFAESAPLRLLSCKQADSIDR